MYIILIDIDIDHTPTHTHSPYTDIKQSLAYAMAIHINIDNIYRKHT